LLGSVSCRKEGNAVSCVKIPLCVNTIFLGFWGFVPHPLFW
jgi:hypothetical protein